MRLRRRDLGAAAWMRFFVGRRGGLLRMTAIFLRGEDCAGASRWRTRVPWAAAEKRRQSRRTPKWAGRGYGEARTNYEWRGLRAHRAWGLDACV